MQPWKYPPTSGQSPAGDFCGFPRSRAWGAFRAMIEATGQGRGGAEEVGLEGLQSDPVGALELGLCWSHIAVRGACTTSQLRTAPRVGL